MTPARQPDEQLVYSSVPWKVYRQDAGMGEHDYAVFLDGVFYCRTYDSQTAQRIVEAIRSRPHTSPPAPCTNPELCSLLREQKAKAKAAREKYEKQIREKLYQLSVGEPNFGRGLTLTMGDVDDAIESLRAQQGGVSE